MKNLLLTFSFLFFSFAFAKAQTYEVTFQVDVSAEALDENNVYLAGDFNDWCDNCTAMNDLGNGQFSFTYTLQAGVHYYKYVIGSWDINPENFTGNESCSVLTDVANRVTPLIDSDLTLDNVCFNSCETCETENPNEGCTDPEAQNYNELATTDDGSCEFLVTFQVDLSQITVNEGDQIYVAGDFNEFCGDCSEMTFDEINNVWTKTETLVEGLNHFKFNLNGWEGNVEYFDGSEPCVEAEGGIYNRVLEVNSDLITPAFCFNECEECSVGIPILVIFQVDMSNELVSDDGVYIVGDFNDWDETATQMTDIDNGVYQAGVFMNENEITNYKYLNGPDYSFEETVPQECGVDNGFGGFNRTYQAGESTETLAPVCFGNCSECTVIPMVNLTFNLNLGPEEASEDGVHLAGSFNNFDPAASTMVNIGDNFYELTLQVPENTAVTYKFINGIDFDQSEIVPFECGVDDGFGGYNRNYNTSTVDVLLDVVCFSSCQDCIVENIEKESLDILFYPNPISAGTRLKISESLQLNKATLMNNLGQEIELSINQGIFIPELPSGMYSIAVWYDGGWFQSRILLN